MYVPDGVLQVHNISLMRAKNLKVTGLGRMYVPDGVLQVHNISLMRAKNLEVIATAALPMEDTGQEGFERDEDGWIFAKLNSERRLEPNERYFLVTSSASGGDF